MASNNFAESVINGTYKKSKQKQQNTSQSSNAFAESVIDGSYKKSKTINVSKEPTTTPQTQTINTINDTLIKTMGKSPTKQTSVANQAQPSTTPLVDNRASINPNASDNEKLRISANNNYNQKLALYEQASQAYKQKRDEELANRGISSDYISKFEDATPEQRLAKPTKEQVEQSAEDARKYQAQREAIDEATKTEMDNAKFAQNQLKYAKYLKDYSDVQNEGVSLYDQTLGHVVRGAQDIFSTWTDDNRYVDENGNVQYLPTYNQMKEEQARNNTLLGNIGLDGLGKFLGDVGYQGTKVATSMGLNALAPYVGTGLYFTDIYADSYKDNINSGMDNEGAMVNAFAKAGQNYIKQKLIGGIGGKLTGGDTSALENALTKGWAKVATNPKVVAALSSMSAEAVDEFTDTYVEKAIDAVTRNDVSIGDVFSPDTFLEALYSGAVGGATGAIGGVNPNSMATAQNAINERLANQNIGQNTDTQIQTETPQIQQNTPENINNQPVIEQTQNEPKTADNEAIKQTNEQIKNNSTEQISLDLDDNVKPETKTENNNIPEVKSEDVIKATNKDMSEKVAKDITETINGNNNQDIKETVKNIEQETGKKMRSWVETSTTATGTTELINSMNKEKITYEPTSNKENLDAAAKELSGMSYEQKLKKAKEIINSDKRLKSTDIAILETVVQEAQKSGNINDFIDLVQDTAILGTESGQVVQALSLIRQSDPTTQLSTLQKLIEREQSKGNKVYDGVQIKPELVEDVLNSYNEDGTWNQQKFDKAMDNLKQDISSQMNTTLSEKLTAWRYLSMLGNPKTHIRNIVANVFMKLLQGAKNKVAAGIEAITPMNKLNKILGGDTKATRGKTLRRSTNDVKTYANTTIDNYFKENKQSSKYNETMGTLKGELERNRKMFKERTPVGKVINKLEKTNSKALDVEDVMFNKAVTKKSFANFLTANGIETQQDIDNKPELVSQALDYALFKGQEATFHQYSKTGEVLRNARESLRGGKNLNTSNSMLNKASSNLSKTGALLMDATLPFINTPINIAKTGIEYTPGVGLLKTISDVKNAPKNLKADVLIDGLSKRFMGGTLAALGFGLAQAGILNGKSGEDKKDKLEKNLGKQGYSINIGGNTFDLSWLSPSAMPMFVGVELYNSTKGKGFSPENIMNLLASTIDPLSEMSVISSVTDALQSYSQGTQALGDIASSAITSYISQYIPTLSSQLATATDDTQRSSTGNTLGEKIINQIKYKLPATTEFTDVGKFLNENVTRKSLPAQVDVWGEEKKYASNPLVRAAEAFLSPANRKEVKIDDTTKEIERVYDNTGSGLPSLSLTKSPKIDADYYNLSSEEYNQYKKDYGKNAKDMLDDLMKQDDYKNADDVEKSKMISAIYEYSTYMAKKRIADEKNITFEYKKSNNKKSYNYPKYYLSLNKDDFAEYVADKYVDYSEEVK